MFSFKITLFESGIRLVCVSSLRQHFYLIRDTLHQTFKNWFRTTNFVVISRLFVFILFALFSSFTMVQGNPKAVESKSVVKDTIRSAFGKIQAMFFDNIPVKGTYEYKNIDFGNGNRVNGFIANVRANYIPTGWIQIRLDAPDGKQIGMSLISQRDGGKEWYIAQTGLYPVDGVHSVFLVYTGAKNAGFDPQIEWFSFTKYDINNTILAGKTLLPAQVPYLGPMEKNFFGNGIAGAGGDTKGVWDYLIGPAYSSVSFIEEEKVSITLNGKDYPLCKDIKRARGTGIFYGSVDIEGITCSLVDFANQNTPFVTRAIFMKNMTGEPVKIVVKANLKPSSFTRIKKPLGKDSVSVSSGETGLNMIVEGKYGMTIALNNTLFFTEATDTGYCIRSGEINIQPGKNYQTGFYHYAHPANDDTKAIITKIRSRDVEKDLESCILNWSKWLAEGISLEKVADQRVRDIIESSTILLKMLQGDDGGIMTTPRVHRISYIRDTHNALRGMIASGHTLEAKNYLLWVHNKFKSLQAKGKFPIPNAAEIGSEGFFPGFGNEENWSSETPGLYILIAANYFKKTKDLETLKKIDESLRFSMKCQLDLAEKNGWRLPFNRDETESGGSGTKLWDYPSKWSMPSLLFCYASLQFFMNYLEMTGETEQLSNYRYRLKLIGNSLDSNFWNEKEGMYDWYRGEHGERPRLPITNFLLMPIYFNYPVNNPKLAVRSAEKMKQYVNERGFIPNQPGTLHDDFCGHGLGYLLYALAEMNDHYKDYIFDSLIFGGTVGCWGDWSESYTADGLSYGENGGQQYWDDHSKVHNLRAFENGTNLDAILRYLNLNKWN
jgi:hypothetical protein